MDRSTRLTPLVQQNKYSVQSNNNNSGQSSESRDDGDSGRFERESLQALEAELLDIKLQRRRESLEAGPALSETVPNHKNIPLAVVPINDEGYEPGEDLKNTRTPVGSKTSSIINLCNTILGAGMLTLPHACSAVGVVPGALLILVSACAAMFGLYLLSESARFVGRNSSFFALCKITYPKTAFLFDFAIAIKCFGVSISYVILIGQLMHEVMVSLNYSKDLLYVQEKFWMTIFMIVIVPLAFLKKLDSMKYTSFLALIAVVYLVVIIIMTAVRPFDGSSIPQAWTWGKTSLQGFEALPVYIFAYTCHQNIFAVFNEMRDNSPKAMKQTIGTSIIICTSVYELIGMVGYFVFGAAVSDNILKNLGTTMSLVVCQIALTVLFVFSYSLQSHPARASFNRLFNAALNATVLRGKYRDRDDMSRAAYVILTSLLLILSYVIAYFCEQVSIVLGVVGATASTSICYILPGIFYYKLHKHKPWTPMKVGSVILFISGVLLVPFMLTFQLMKILKIRL